MSQFKIAMKKDSMRKNKKLVINIALKKEGLASRLEADQDLGSSRMEKERFESETRRDVFQGVCSKAKEIDGFIDEDKAIDDHSSVRDGMMREADVGTGLSGALNLLREQGTFKRGKSKLVGVMDDHEHDTKRDGFKEIQIERVDECGRILTQKEAFRLLSHGFHGKRPGKRKQEKWKKKQEDKLKQMESSDRAVERMRQVHANLKRKQSMHPETKQSRRVRISSSKKIQICTGNVEDKFSSLHESVLSRILSYLPTVEAVRTSVLSKSWRNMWTNITDLQFDDRRHRDPRDYRFTEFVERVLRDIGSPQINSFHLRSVNSYDETLLISWLSNVLRRNLQRLVIRVLASKLEKITFSGDDSQKILLSFPPSLPDAYLALSRPNWPKKFLHSFTCVKSLGLELSKDFEVVKVPKFRQLVYLHLIYDMTQHSKFRKFLKSAPMLEMLSIRDLASPGSVTSSKTLKRLRLKKAPDCIRTMLKVLQIRNFNTSELQLSVLRYVMENAGILGPIILSTPKPITEESKALVLSYPKASPHASVFFE